MAKPNSLVDFHTGDDAALRNLITTPAPLRHLCGERVLTCEWLAGPQLLDVFRESRAALPRAQARTFGSWRRLYATLHSCWGAQIFRQGEFHTDPHPGNVVLLEDGRVGLLDWGQTKVLPPDKVDSCAECVICMARGDTEGLARTIEASGIAELANPSVALWALISYTYFDTRWTPLAGVNLYDVDRSLLAPDDVRKSKIYDAFAWNHRVCTQAGRLPPQFTRGLSPDPHRLSI